jgi:hypothetical protein
LQRFGGFLPRKLIFQNFFDELRLKREGGIVCAKKGLRVQKFKRPPDKNISEKLNEILQQIRNEKK